MSSHSQCKCTFIPYTEGLREYLVSFYAEDPPDEMRWLYYDRRGVPFHIKRVGGIPHVYVALCGAEIINEPMRNHGDKVVCKTCEAMVWEGLTNDPN